MHQPIQINNLSLAFPHKTCFDEFNTVINYGDHIAIIGRNGCGKSSLLKLLYAKFADHGVTPGYVPQVISEFNHLSGGQRLNSAITQALTTSINSNVLMLDEPTNHLDASNRSSLMRMLHAYPGTLIIISHDNELLDNYISIIWHIDNNKIHVFTGNYTNYMRTIHNQRASIEQQLAQLNRQTKDTHQALMQEQARASKRKAYGEKKYDGDKLSLRNAQSCGEQTHNKNKKRIATAKSVLIEQLANLSLPEIILPKFSLTASDISDRTIISIYNASISYKDKDLLLEKLSLSLRAKERIAIQGDNASGKSTLIKAILGEPSVIRTGDWTIPKLESIGYLDQHYTTLTMTKTVCETIIELVPTWSYIQVRRHLTDFLFRSNMEVNTQISHLSGGEKVRLCLAQIAAKTPRLLILDEITNNLDLETKMHVISVLKVYPGAIIIISHDTQFLQAIGIQDYYNIIDKKLLLNSLNTITH